MKLVKEIDLIKVKKDNFDDVVKFIRKYHTEKECKIELLNSDSDRLLTIKVTFDKNYSNTLDDVELYYCINTYITSDSSCSGNIRIYKFTEQDLHDKLEFDGFEIVED